MNVFMKEYVQDVRESAMHVDLNVCAFGSRASLVLFRGI